MQLVQSEDQDLLAKTAADFADRHSPVSRLRALRDAHDATGFSRDLWKQMAELGWVGILLPERFGGAEMGLAELAALLEALGRRLVPEPFLGALLLGPEALARGGGEAQQQAWLPAVAAGERIVTLAHHEPGARHARTRVATRAERDGDGWRLHGEKQQVEAAHAADAVVVPARTAGDGDDPHGITLFLVPADTEGVAVERQWRIDARPVARLRLDGARVGDDAVVGERDGGVALLGALLDRASVGLCAEMLGGMGEAFDRTLAYLKDRRQFGAPIGSFQALQHRAARLYITIELARSAVMAAARGLDADDPEATKLVSMAKALCSDGYLHVANEAVQMHGGIGMTDGHEIGFFLKRARAAEATFGDAAWHRARWAELSGY